MSRINTIGLVCCVGLLAVALPRAKADAWNQQTTFTFSAPVEIPGQVLAPGTYVFKLLDSLSDRDIVQVFNKDQNHVYGTFITIPDYRLKPTGRPIITFKERAAGAPVAVRAWFYPGENYGHEFVYGKVKAVALAQANQMPVASMPAEVAENTTKPIMSKTEPAVTAMEQAPLKAQKPTQEEVEIAEAFPPAPTPAPAATTAENMPQKLPKTGSPLPLIALIGLASLGAAGLLRRAASKSA